LSGVLLYRAAGLTLTADRPLPHLPFAVDHITPDVRIHTQSSPFWHLEPAVAIHQSETYDADDRPIVTISASPSGYRFEYADETTIWVNRAGTEVWCTWSARSSIEDAATYLVGPVLGFLLRLRGAFALHASGVAIDHAAVAFVGPHGAGKSTIAAALGRRGFPVLADDILRLTRDGSHWAAEPFGGILRLWPESEPLVLQSCDTLPRITPTWDKRALTVGDRGTRPAVAPVPLRGIVFLDPRGSVSCVATLAPAEALIRLTVNSTAAHLLDPARRADEFVTIAELVRTVPAVAAVSRDDPRGFDDFVDDVLRWVRRHARAA